MWLPKLVKAMGSFDDDMGPSIQYVTLKEVGGFILSFRFAIFEMSKGTCITLSKIRCSKNSVGVIHKKRNAKNSNFYPLIL